MVLPRGGHFVNRRGFFGAFTALGAAPVAAMARAMQDDPVTTDESGNKVINGNVRINGDVEIQMTKGSKAGLTLQRHPEDPPFYGSIRTK